uniref:Uncharacterized protein n=1 Tax=Ditylenchus dipsaci TaxID=166011 RepID=A0A915CNY7_9BILA
MVPQPKQMKSRVQENKVMSLSKPLTSEQITANRPLTSLADLGLKKDEMTDLCRKFSTIAAQHCYKPKIEIEFLDKSKPSTRAIANAFRSSVGATVYDWVLKASPTMYSMRKAQFEMDSMESYGGGYSQDMSVSDFWGQKEESGANWRQIWGRGRGATHIHIPLKEGDFGKPVGLTNGYHVGPYVGFAETVGMDWMNGGVSTRRAVGLPIVGVNASSGSSIAFPGLSSFISKTGLGDALNAMG